MARIGLTLAVSALAPLVAASWPPPAEAQQTRGAGDWRRLLAEPGPEFSQMPLWFWNDDLDDAEIKRQMADFRAHGVFAFIIHPRMGLPTDIAFLGERWMGHVRTAVEEAARTSMRVCLYDEWMYPSGSAHGEVVRMNPAFASRGLGVVHRDLSGPADVDVPIPEGGVPVATILAPRAAGRDAVELPGARSVEPSARTVSVPAGEWRVMAFYSIPSGGRIRGVHAGEDDGQPRAPAAGDLLSPEAMQAYIHLALDPYVALLKGHLGTTVVGVFTDEPSLLGRRARRGLRPWTEGLPAYFERRRGYSILPLLPALFFDAGPRTQAVREDFETTLRERLDETYYAPLSAWCDKHGLALTGHPAGHEDIGPLRHFHVPGQDIVWRWLLPNTPSALEGGISVVGKSTSSVARHDRRRRNTNEVFGAYGWELTMDEMKWLTDWLAVRGVNQIAPHAFYYSVRGERRNERPPDVGPNNTWWPEYRTLADYTARLSGLMADHRQVCDVAVLCRDDSVPWRAAKWLYQNQIDFNYLEAWRLEGQARLEGSAIRVAEMAYRTLVLDTERVPGGAAHRFIGRFEQQGGRVVRWDSREPDPAVFSSSRDALLVPPSVDLRVSHVVKHDVHFYLLVNEGASVIAGELTVRGAGSPEWYDAWKNEFRPAEVRSRDAGRLVTPLRLEPHASLVLCMEGGG